MLESPLAAGGLDQDAPHRLGRGREEVGAAVPAWARLGPHEPEIGLVDQRRRLERLAGLLLPELPGRQLAQLVVDQREKCSAAFGSPCSMAERIEVTSFIDTRRSLALQQPGC